jgi:tRNA/tmRNA/rRNA uracil-C5-methylase (TrmA/RlmC/RlmD family)
VQPWAYLHQVTYRITDEGELALPGRGGGTAYARACALIHPDLLDLYDQLDLELAGFSQVRLLRGSLLDGSDGGRMVVLVASEPATPELETDLDASINLILPDNEPLNLIGDSHVTYQPGGPFGALALRVTAGSFVRPNAPMLPALAEAVLALLDPQPAWRVLDLYAGVGVFSAALAPHVSLISLVESYPPAATDADLNLGAFEHVDVIEGSVEAVLEAHAGDAVDAEGDTDALPLHDRYDAAIVDPSGGLGAAVIGGLWARGVHRLVYVSSDPLALARDCALLAARGYALTAVRAIDLMPHTAFVDSIARFDRLDTAR